MSPRGPKARSTEPLEHVGVKMPAELKQRLIRAVMLRKAQDPSLPIRWGLSDYIREVIAAHLEGLSADEAPRKTRPDRRAAP